MAKRKRDKVNDDDVDKKRGIGNKSEPEKIIKSAMDRLGVKGHVREKTVPCNLESLSCPEEILNRIRGTVVWVSKLKARASLFFNWHMLQLVAQGGRIPILKDTIFTQVFRAVTGSGSEFSGSYTQFCEETGHSILLWQKGNSQILSHVKNEMVTIIKTSITVHFWKRRLTFMRWKIVNTISQHLLSLTTERRKKLVWRLSTLLMGEGGTENKDYEGFSQDLPEDLIQPLRELAIFEQSQLGILVATIRGQLVDDKLDSKTNKKSRAELLQILISKHPLATIKYFHDQFVGIQDMNITKRWMECSATLDFEPWPWWKGLRCPSFSPAPFYKVARHFIRIDQRTLSEWNMENLLDETKWWLSSIFELYGGQRRGRISDLYKWRHLCDPQTAEACLNVDDIKADDRPCLPGASFTTDGVAAHISIITFPTHHKHLDSLSKKGYSGVKEAETSKDRTIIGSDAGDIGCGVVKLESCVLGNGWQDIEVTGVDPGAIQVVSYCHSTMGDLSTDREKAITNAMDTGQGYGEELYKVNSGRCAHDWNEKRRRQIIFDYHMSLRMLTNTHRKTFDIDLLTQYATARRYAEPGLESEVHHIARSCFRRKRFVRQQLCIDHITHKILGGADRKYRRISKRTLWPIRSQRRVVFFGRALFSGTKGHVTVPRKRLIRILASKSMVVLVDEFNTSKLCPYDHQVLETSEDRIRQCQTETHGSFFSADRDVIGSVNILQKAVYQLLGNTIGAFYPS